MWHNRAPLSVIVLVHFSSSHCLFCLEPVAVLVTLHAPNNVPHRICRPCCGSLFTYNTATCPACRSPVDMFKVLGIPLCSACNLEPTAAHCFNPNCLTDPNSTPVCKPCSYTIYFLTNPNCPSCGGARPIPYIDPFIVASIINLY